MQIGGRFLKMNPVCIFKNTRPWSGKLGAGRANHYVATPRCFSYLARCLFAHFATRLRGKPPRAGIIGFELEGGRLRLRRKQARPRGLAPGALYASQLILSDTENAP
jgi:hypothetical protein